MAQDPADVVEADPAQLPVALLVEEQVLAAGEERLVRVHAAAVDPEDRLRHERRVKAVAAGDVLHDEAERAHVVRRHDRVVVPEVDLVLARRDLVMRRFDVEPHLLERQDDLAPHVLAEIDRGQVEVAAGIVRFGGRLAVGAAMKQEELRLGPGAHDEAFLLGEADRALQG